MKRHLFRSKRITVSLAIFGFVLGLLGTSFLVAQEWTPTWKAIEEHQVPEWYHNAKLGIFIHWGLYSVPAWAPTTGELGKVDWDQWFQKNPYAEWYLNTMKIEGSPTRQHHMETYGEDFDYYDFANTFNREVQKWNSKEWAELFQEVGARYVVLTTKHHDGFTLWPSRIQNPHLPENKQGSKKDLVGELTEQVRSHGMRMGLYYSGGLDWSFNPTPIQNMTDLRTTAPQGDDYATLADLHWRELMDRYSPDILWNDISYPRKEDAKAIFLEFYSRNPEGVVNNRWSLDFADFKTPEYSKEENVTPYKWEACRGLGFSFGYNRAEGTAHMLSAAELVHLLADIVSKNGNLLLNIGPMADGTIPALQVKRLRQLGTWLDVNGEAIFDTRPWSRAQGTTTEGMELRFTRAADVLYLIVLGVPNGPSVTIEDLSLQEGAIVELLGSAESLDWSAEEGNIRVSLPAEMPGSYAISLKMYPISNKAEE